MKSIWWPKDMQLWCTSTQRGNMPLPSTKIVYITFMLQGRYFFCCLNKQHITTNHIYYLFRQIKIGINPIKKEATLFVSKPEYQNPWMFFVHSQVSVTARSNKLDGQFPGIYLYSTTSCTHWQLNRLLSGVSFAGKLKNDNNNIIVYNLLIIAELKNYCSDCEKDTVVERERGKGMERYYLIL